MGISVTLTDLQSAYDRGDGLTPTILLDGTRDGIVIRDDGAVTGPLFAVEDSASVQIVGVEPNQLDVGRVGRRGYSMQDADGTGYPTTVYMPDGATRTTLTGGSMFSWSSTVTTNVPGGGGIGNDNAPSLVSWNGECIFADQGNLFATQLLVNAAATLTAQANIGPQYLFIDQYLMRGDGGARTGSQHNALRIQPRWGPNISGGSFTQTSADMLLFTATVDATVGSTSITTLRNLSMLDPTRTAGGTIGTWVGMEIANITTTGITTIRGIRSAMANGQFIEHTGAAVSTFAGDVHLNNGISVVLGSTGSNRVELLRPSAGVLRMIGVGGTQNEGIDIDFDGSADVVEFSSSTGAAIQFDYPYISLGGTAPLSTSNFWMIWTAPSGRAPSVNGDYFDTTFTVAGSLDLTGRAMSNVATMALQEPSISLGGGTVANAYTLFIQNAPTEGTSINAALRVGSGLSSLDDLEVRGDVGFYGTGPTAQPTITGSRGGNAALADLLTKVAAQGLFVDSTSA